MSFKEVFKEPLQARSYAEALAAGATTGTAGGSDAGATAEAASAASASGEQPPPGYLRCSCFCGAVTLYVDLSHETVSASVCHCSTCRRTSGGPFMTNVGVTKEAVELRVHVVGCTGQARQLVENGANRL